MTQIAGAPVGQGADYARVAQAIRFIEENRLDQPRLEDVAGAMGLSAFHAQRLFTRWVGISPKRFLDLCTIEHAKTLLRDRQNLLDTAYDVGLSGPSRLHDLFVRLEALTPGEYKSDGAGLVMRWGVHETPFGPALFVASPRGLARLAFVADEPVDGVLDEAATTWPLSRFEEDRAATAGWVERSFGRSASDDPLPLLVKGTAFQIQVWRALLRIPAGSTITYGELAAALGRPGAARAVGSACGQNRIGFLIPCHRVIRETGALGGYRWGLTMKRAMLAWENARLETVAA